MDSISIGLDIGSSAVRAAELSVDRGRVRLRRFGQVGLPSGAVVDGEVVNPIVVAEALRRLWAEAGFTSNKVVLGVSGHRLIVRQAEVPAVDEEDLRSSLRFGGQDLIPIPMEDAVFDFQILERNVGEHNGQSTIRILIVAAHKEMLRAQLAAVKEAGLDAVAVDASPLALMRVVPPAGPDTGVEALVSIGAELTTVAVRDSGAPRFIRSLAVGGANLTTGIASSMRVEPAVAEALKRGGGRVGSPQLAQARKAIAPNLRDIGEDVRATIDFFVSQADGSRIERLLVTGGASLTEGLVEELAGDMDVDIRRIDPFALVTLEDFGLSDQDLRRARATATTAIGLALWTATPAENRMSVLPGEVAAARKARRLAATAAAAVAGLVGLLGIAGAAEVLKVHLAQSHVHDAQRRAAVLQANVAELQAKTAIHGKVAARVGMVKTALQGDIDWVRVLKEIQTTMPSSLQIQSATGGKSTGAASKSSGGIGTLTFSLTGNGGLPAVAAWIDALQKDPSVQGNWVSGLSVINNGGTVNFSASATLTTRAQSDRAKAVKQ
jgi:type IV pilus assembly protein PilM